MNIEYKPVLKGVTTLFRWAYTVIICLGITSCSDPIPYSTSDSYSTDVQEQYKTGLTHSDDDVLKLVKQGPAQNSNLTNEEWARQLSDGEAGQVMFPQWKVKRKGANQYEVRYTYTVLQPDHIINKKGVSWTADMVLRIVGPPRILPPQEMAGRNQDRWLQSQQTNSNTLYKKTIRKMPVLKE